MNLKQFVSYKITLPLGLIILVFAKGFRLFGIFFVAMAIIDFFRQRRKTKTTETK